jgi:hypothetical protein
MQCFCAYVLPVLLFGKDLDHQGRDSLQLPQGLSQTGPFFLASRQIEPTIDNLSSQSIRGGAVPGVGGGGRVSPYPIAVVVAVGPKTKLWHHPGDPVCVGWPMTRVYKCNKQTTGCPQPLSGCNM